MAELVAEPTAAKPTARGTAADASEVDALKTKLTKISNLQSPQIARNFKRSAEFQQKLHVITARGLILVCCSGPGIKAFIFHRCFGFQKKTRQAWRSKAGSWRAHKWPGDRIVAGKPSLHSSKALVFPRIAVVPPGDEV